METNIIVKLEDRLKYRKERVESLYNPNNSPWNQTTEYFKWYGRMEELESIIDMLKRLG